MILALKTDDRNYVHDNDVSLINERVLRSYLVMYYKLIVNWLSFQKQRLKNNIANHFTAIQHYQFSVFKSIMSWVLQSMLFYLINANAFK